MDRQAWHASSTAFGLPGYHYPSLAEWPFALRQKLWSSMRKAMIMLMSFCVGPGIVAATEPAAFPNDPRLYATIGGLKSLLQSKPAPLHWVTPNSELKVGDSTILVIYTSEGSGLIHEFAYAYRCLVTGQCTLFTMAYAPAMGASRLSHRFDSKSNELTFWSNGRQVVAAQVPD